MEVALKQEESNNNEVIGIFCAPQMHERNMRVMQSSIDQYDITLNGITDHDLLEIFMTKDREKIVSKLSEPRKYK